MGQLQNLLVKDGDTTQIVSDEEWIKWFDAVAQNEGNEAADEWYLSGAVLNRNSSLLAEQSYIIGCLMIKRWEAFQTLGLFKPAIML